MIPLRWRLKKPSVNLDEVVPNQARSSAGNASSLCYVPTRLWPKPCAVLTTFLAARRANVVQRLCDFGFIGLDLMSSTNFTAARYLCE